MPFRGHFENGLLERRARQQGEMNAKRYAIVGGHDVSIKTQRWIRKRQRT